MTSELHTECRGSTLVLSISEPASRNTLSPQVCAAGVEALNTAESNPEIRCIVWRGEGSNFCLASEETSPLDAVQNLVDAVRSCAKPVIAAVEGWADGAGCALALACDLVVAADDARFAWPTGSSTPRLAAPLPRPLRLEALWLGAALDANRLHAMGWVNRLCGSGLALSEALLLAQSLAERDEAALANAKECLNQTAPFAPTIAP